MKTAMQELEEKLKDNLKWIVLNADYELMDKLFIQGLEKEKEQIIDAAKSCNYIGGATNIEAEDYYNQTYHQMPELRNADGTYGSWGTSGNDNQNK
jgi:hypothetical protein